MENLFWSASSWSKTQSKEAGTLEAAATPRQNVANSQTQVIRKIIKVSRSRTLSGSQRNISRIRLVYVRATVSLITFDDYALICT